MKKTQDRFAKPKASPIAKNSDDHKQELNVVFGVLPVLEALRADKRKIEKIFILDGANEKRLAEIVQLARQKRIQFTRSNREILERLVKRGANHQGVVAVVSAADYYNSDRLIDEVKSAENSLSLILDGVEDPRNLGAILRVAECAGIVGVFIPERRAVGLTETVSKSSAGATEYVKVAKVTNVNNLIDELKEHNIWVIGASGDAVMDYTEWDWTQPSALVMGGEGNGLHRLTAEKCDVLVKIPMLGQIDSLNVSVASGVILFEAVRQRSNAKTNKKAQ